MIQINFESLPKLPQADRRPVVRIATDQIANTGVAFNTFGIRQGDVIEFPSFESAIVVSQPIRQGSQVLQYLVGVSRNGKPDYLALGALTRTDIDRNPTCEFTKQMGELNNNAERLQFLAGKKITCKEMKTIKIQAFDRTTGERLEGQTRDQQTPVITYAE